MAGGCAAGRCHAALQVSSRPIPPVRSRGTSLLSRLEVGGKRKGTRLGAPRGERWKQPPARLGRRRSAGARAQGAAGAGHGRNRGVRGAWARRGGGRRAWEGPGGAGLGRCQGQCLQSGCGVQQVGTPGGRPRGGRARDQLLQGAEDSLAGAAGNFNGLIAGNLKRLDIKKEVGDKSDQLGKNPHILLGEDESQLNSYRQIGERRLSRPLEAAV